MDILKQHSEKFILLGAAIILLASSVMIFLNLSSFNTSLNSLSDQSGEKNPPPELTIELLGNAQDMAAEPAQWEANRPLFVSRPYVLIDGRPVSVEDDDTVVFHEPVPNKWFRDNQLDILDTGILQRDPDGDGFINLDEWQGGTDPQDQESKPPYYTKLRLQEFQQKNFRILFAQRTGDTYQIETIDTPRPTQFLKLGDTISGTEYEIIKFEEKYQENPATGGRRDVSELTIRNKESGREIVLIIEKVVNDPDSSAVLRDLWSGETINVEQGGQFALSQEPDTKYELISVDEQGATLKELSTGREVRIPKNQ